LQTTYIDLIAGSVEQLAELIARLDLASTKYGMEISAEKSKILSMEVNMQTSPDISIGRVRLEVVDSFKSLGAKFTKDRRSASEIKTRIAIAAGSVARLQKLWQSKTISTKSKVSLMKAIVISTALYGCETWTLTAETEARIHAAL